MKKIIQKRGKSNNPTIGNRKNKKEYPNDSLILTPIIKYIRNLSPNTLETNITTPYLNHDYNSLNLNNEELYNNISERNPKIDINRLTITNNTNISNLNLYFLYNSEKTNPEKNVIKRNAESIKKKEPEDNIKKKIIDINFKKIKIKENKNNKRDNKFNRFPSIKYSFKKLNSKSPLNNYKKRNNLLNENTFIKNKKHLTYTEIIVTEPTGKFNLSEFTIINQIGKGTFAKIFDVKWKKNNKNYALKKESFISLEFVEKRKNVVNIIKDFLNKTNNNGIINIYSNFWEKKNKEYNYYELMEIGELDWEKEIISRTKNNLYYTEEELFNIASQLIKTLSLMQKNHITHRDIKPQNILVVKGQYKLCDFGEIRIMKKEGIVVQRIRGSELYMSPILFLGLRTGLIQVKHNTYKSDVFSLGMCLLYAASMHFSGTDEIREMTDMNLINIVLNKYLGDRYSNKIISLIYLMLQTEEQLRPDFIELEKKLNFY